MNGFKLKRGKLDMRLNLFWFHQQFCIRSLLAVELVPLSFLWEDGTS